MLMSIWFLEKTSSAQTDVERKIKQEGKVTTKTLIQKAGSKGPINWLFLVSD